MDRAYLAEAERAAKRQNASVWACGGNGGKDTIRCKPCGGWNEPSCKARFCKDTAFCPVRRDEQAQDQWACGTRGTCGAVYPEPPPEDCMYCGTGGRQGRFGWCASGCTCGTATSRLVGGLAGSWDCPSC